MRSISGKVVVTGGAGFIGSHLVDRLLNDGYRQVVVLDNFRRGQRRDLARYESDSRLRVVTGDVRDTRMVSDLMQGARIVYHLAAESAPLGRDEDLEYGFTTNVVGTFNVLRAASEAGVERLVFTSSCEVYGEVIDLPADEGQPLLAADPAGASKVVGEAYCRAFRRVRGLQSVVLRLATVYGPGDTDRVIPRWIDRAIAGQDLEVCGSRDLVDVVWIGQVVDALVHAAEVPGALPPINVGSGTGTLITDLARRILRQTGGRGHVKPSQAGAARVMRFVANVNRMREMLGVEPPDDPLMHLDGMLAARMAAVTRRRPAAATA